MSEFIKLQLLDMRRKAYVTVSILLLILLSLTKLCRGELLGLGCLRKVPGSQMAGRQLLDKRCLHML